MSGSVRDAAFHSPQPAAFDLEPAPRLAVRDLTVELPLEGGFHPVVEAVTFELAAGESLAVVGESGCGKSMLARALLGLAPEWARVSGSIRAAGRELLGLSEAGWREVRGGRIALVFQEPAAALDPVATVGAQVAEAVRLHRPGSRARARQIALARLAEVSFADPDRILDEYPHRLSGGQKQRALLAIALAGDPVVLIADEPTASLDATVAADVLDLLRRLRRERNLSILLVTHDMGIVAEQTDRALVLYAGRVVEVAPTAALFRAPRHPYTQGLLRSVPKLESLRGPRLRRFETIPGYVPDLARRPRGCCAFEPRCAERFAPCAVREPNLYTAGESLARCFLYEPAPPSGGRS